MEFKEEVEIKRLTPYNFQLYLLQVLGEYNRVEFHFNRLVSIYTEGNND